MNYLDKGHTFKGTRSVSSLSVFFCQEKTKAPSCSKLTFPLEFGAENLTAAQKYIELTNSTKKLDPPPIYPSLDKCGGGGVELQVEILIKFGEFD